MKPPVWILLVCILVAGNFAMGLLLDQAAKERDQARAEVAAVQNELKEGAQAYQTCQNDAAKLRLLATDALGEMFRAEPILEECALRLRRQRFRQNLHPPSGNPQ